MNKRIANRYVAMFMAVIFTLASVFATSTMTVSAATKLKVTPSAKTIAVNKTVVLKANKAVKWSVTKGTKVVKITKKSSKSVTVKGLKAGTATVKAKAGKKSVTAKITVKTPGKVTTGEEISGKVVADFDLSKGSYKDGKVTKIWIPVPENDRFQTITNVEASFPNAEVKETKDSAGNKIIYVEFGENVAPEKRTGQFSYNVTRKQIKSTDMVEIGTVDKKAMAKYLGEFETSGSLKSGIVKETADKIVKDAKAKTVLEKAKAIFDWEVQNLYRRETAVDDLKFNGCGRGEVQMVLETTKGGKCTDLNSTFVALLRSQGIPAREKFGMRINNGNTTDNLNAPEHCRAEFYLPGTGWVEADPADTLKALLKDGVSYESGKVGREARATEERWTELYNTYWGANDNNWVKIAMGRDITLEPKQEGKCPSDAAWTRCVLNTSGTLNNMGYIYGETDGVYMNAYSAKEFGYTYKFEAAK